MTELAPKLHALGAGIFPLRGLNAPDHERAKAPSTPRGLHDAVYYPDPLPGLPGGAYGLVPPPGVVVLDVDRKDGGSDGLTTLEGLPGYAEVDTFTVATPSGGLHLYFRTSREGLKGFNGGQRLPGLDGRTGDGRYYLVGPGSRTPLGEYEVVEGDLEDLAPLPSWLEPLFEGGVSLGAEIFQSSITEPLPERKDLTALAKRWKSMGDRGRAMSGALSWVLKGKAYAAEGARHDVTRDLAMWLSRAYPLADPKAFGERFLIPAWIDMYDNEANANVENHKWVGLWTSALAKERERRSALATAEKDRERDRIRLARFGATDQYYSEGERERIEAWLGGGVEDRLICQLKGLYWLLGLDRAGNPSFLGPRTGEELPVAARDILSPWGKTATTEVFDEVTGKFKLKPRGDLVFDYGFSVDKVTGAFYGTSAFTPENRSLRLRYAALEPCTPTYHEDIAAWLRRLAQGGEAHERLLDWIACSTTLDEAAPALLLYGAPGSGKSLAARGVASCFGVAKAVEGGKLRSFNAELMHCPVVEFGEHLKMDLDSFKELITATSQQIEPKGRDKIWVDGALRVVLSMNNLESLRTKRALTSDDIRALEDRLIIIPTTDERLDVEVARMWLDTGALREHFRWLGENHTVAPGKRLCCRPYVAGDLGETMLDGNEPFERAAEVLVGVATERLLVLSPADKPALARRGEEVLMRPGVLLADVRDMNPSAFARALAAVGYTASRAFRVGGAFTRFATLPKDGFRFICETQEEDPEELWRGLPEV